MSAPVDVLAVMDYSADMFGQHGWNTSADALIEARAASAVELIEADKYYDDAQFGLARARYNGESLDRWTQHCTEADLRRAAAIARVGGRP